MYPNKPQMSEGDKMERANNSLPLDKGHPKKAAARELFKQNVAEHALRTGATVQQLTREWKENPRNTLSISAEAVTRARKGEPSVYRTSKDL